MDLLIWLLIFLASSLLWAWIIFWDGAEWLEGSILSGILISYRALAWTPTGIRVAAACLWTGQTIWFIAGLFNPHFSSS